MNKKPWLILGIIVCIIYILSPIDLIPEFLLGPMGLIGDVWIFAFMLFLIKYFWGLCDKKHDIDFPITTWQMTLTLVSVIRPSSLRGNDTV